MSSSQPPTTPGRLTRSTNKHQFTVYHPLPALWEEVAEQLNKRGIAVGSTAYIRNKGCHLTYGHNAIKCDKCTANNIKPIVPASATFDSEVHSSHRLDLANVNTLHFIRFSLCEDCYTPMLNEHRDKIPYNIDGSSEYTPRRAATSRREQSFYKETTDDERSGKFIVLSIQSL